MQKKKTKHTNKKGVHNIFDMPDSNNKKNKQKHLIL